MPPKSQHHHECKSADELLDCIRPRLPCLDRGELIYRGVGDARYKLIPKALRDHYLKPLQESNFDACRRELAMLRDLLEACDRMGLQVPGDSMSFRSSLRHERPFSRWPLPEHFHLWAVAQHHGLPTRLLDWTRNPFNAAYFAATACLVDLSQEHLAVWVLDRAGKPAWEKRIVVVTIPTFHSPNLAAQAGLFTVTVSTDMMKPTEQLQAEALEDIVDACSAWMAKEPPRAGSAMTCPMPEVLLSKYTLHRQHARDLLELCRAYGVSGATMYPGFDGACKEVLERKLSESTRLAPLLRRS